MRRERRRIRKGGKRGRAFRTCKAVALSSLRLLLPLRLRRRRRLLLLPASRFPSFPHQGRSRGRLYTPLQCLGVHYIQLGYFSREFSHVNAARARTFARAHQRRARANTCAAGLCVCTRTLIRAALAGREPAGISHGNFVRHRGISFWELLIFEGSRDGGSSGEEGACDKKRLVA